jgi:glutamyl-tRNA reductase
MRLILVGTSYQRAPVELRELLAYDAGLRREALARLSERGAEAAVLSTCNRTEVYAVDAEPAAAEERIYGELAGLSGLSHSELAPALYTVTDEAAAVHLFRVAAGLDSMVPGEAQILGQVREAYEAAREAATTGSTLHRLFRQALRVGKRVRTETAAASPRSPWRTARVSVRRLSRAASEARRSASTPWRGSSRTPTSSSPRRALRASCSPSPRSSEP